MLPYATTSFFTFSYIIFVCDFPARPSSAALVENALSNAELKHLHEGVNDVDTYWETAWQKQAWLGSPGAKLQYVYLKQIRKALKQRKTKAGALGTDSKAWRHRQHELRHAFRSSTFYPLERLEENFSKTHLNYLISSQYVDPRGFTVQSFVLETRPGAYIPATLWTPWAETSQSAKFPAVVLAPGHHPLGYRDDLQQQLAINLVLLLQVVVLTFDPLSQGEHHQFRHRNFTFGECGFNDETCDEHNMTPCTRAHDAIGQQLFLLNSSLIAYFVYDALRFVDFVERLNYVNPHRIAMLGTSGGGMLTAYVGAVDDRIHASVIGSYLGTWRMLRSTMCHFDAEQIWWRGIEPMLLEKMDLVIARAPKATLLVFGSADGCLPVQDTYPAFLEAVDAFNALGGSGAPFFWSQTVGGHGWNEEQLTEVYDFLASHGITSNQRGHDSYVLKHVNTKMIHCSKLTTREALQQVQSRMRYLPDIVSDLWADARIAMRKHRLRWSQGRSARSELLDVIRKTLRLDLNTGAELGYFDAVDENFFNTWRPESKAARVEVMHVGARPCVSTLRFYHTNSFSHVIIVLGGSSDPQDEPVLLERRVVEAGLASDSAVVLLGVCGLGGPYRAAATDYLPLFLGRSHASFMVTCITEAMKFVTEMVLKRSEKQYVSLLSFGDTAVLLTPEPDLLSVLDRIIVYDSLAAWGLMEDAWQRGSNADLSELLPFHVLIHGAAHQYDIPDLLAMFIDAGVSVIVAAPRGMGGLPLRSSRLKELFILPESAALERGPSIKTPSKRSPTFRIIQHATDWDVIQILIDDGHGAE